MSLGEWLLVAAFFAFALTPAVKAVAVWRKTNRMIWLGKLADRELTLAKKYLAAGDEPRAIIHARESSRLHAEWEKVAETIKT